MSQTRPRNAYVRNLRQSKSGYRLRFENLLFDCLNDIGFHVIEQSWSENDPEPWLRCPFSPPSADSVVIYEHKSFLQAPDGDAFYMEMYHNGTFTVDPKGWGPLQASMASMPNVSHIDPGQAAAYCRELSRRFRQSGTSKHKQPPPRRITDIGPYIFVPLQLSKDDTILYHSPIKVTDFIDVIGEWAGAKGWTLVFKLHPYDNERRTARAVERWTHYPNTYHRQDNIHSLICGAELVCTINSGSGFESLIHGKPVVTFGDSDYRWVTFRGERHNLDEAYAYGSEYSAAQQEAAYVWVYYYLTEHVFDVRPEDLGRVRSRLSNQLREFTGF
jgi:Capsule polysaccharide biosynthesis protein